VFHMRCELDFYIPEGGILQVTIVNTSNLYAVLSSYIEFQTMNKVQKSSDSVMHVHHH
jgi:hypothetical protein